MAVVTLGVKIITLEIIFWKAQLKCSWPDTFFSSASFLNFEKYTSKMDVLNSSLPA